MSASSQATTSASSRCGRPQTISYADLMKPDEDWRNLPDAAERRKIQNRLAQRAYRRNMRDRTKEVEKLKKQLQQLQRESGSRTNTPPPERETESGNSTPGRRSPMPPSKLNTTPPMMTGSNWMGGYVNVWPQPHEQDGPRGLGLSSNNVDNSIYFPPSANSNDRVSSPMPTVVNTRTRAVSASHAQQQSVVHHQGHMRSISNPLFFSSTGFPSPTPAPWVQMQRGDSGDSLHIPNISATGSPQIAPANLQAPMLALSPSSFSLYSSNNRDEMNLPHPDTSFTLEEGMPRHNASFPTPPDSDLSGPPWSPDDHHSLPSIGSPSVLSHTPHTGEVAHPLPETNAPLLHFAVTGGHVETLRLLLSRSDVSINGRDNCGYTALQRAVMLGRNDMVALLLEHGADFNLLDENPVGEFMKVDVQ